MEVTVPGGEPPAPRPYTRVHCKADAMPLWQPEPERLEPTRLRIIYLYILEKPLCHLNICLHAQRMDRCLMRMGPKYFKAAPQPPHPRESHPPAPPGGPDSWYHTIGGVGGDNSGLGPGSYIPIYSCLGSRAGVILKSEKSPHFCWPGQLPSGPSGTHRKAPGLWRQGLP